MELLGFLAALGSVILWLLLAIVVVLAALLLASLVLLLRRRARRTVQEAAQAAQAPLLERLNALEQRLVRLERREAGFRAGSEPPAGPGQRPVLLPGELPPPAPPAPRPPEPVIPEPVVPVPAGAGPAAATPAAPRTGGWRRLERGIENWTGRLGAAAVVAGVTFLLVHTAFRFDPFQRFLLTLALAAVLAGLAAWLERRRPWRELGQWLGAAAGAIALLGCAAAGGLPGLGLQWIREPAAALGVLLAGILLNLLLAWRARRQALAAFHLVVALLPLAIVPPSAMAITIATLIALVGIALALRRRWDRHLLVVVAASGLHHLLWYVQTDLPFRNESVRPAGLLAALALFGAGALAEHLRRPPRPDPPLTALLAHLTSWSGLTLALLAYPTEASGRALGCGLATAAAVLLGRLARRRQAIRLARSEGLIAQTLALVTLFSLAPLLANGLLLLLAVFAEGLLVLRLLGAQGDPLLRRVARGLALGAGWLFALLGLIPSIAPSTWQNAALLLLGAALASAASIDLQRGPAARPVPQLGWLAGGLVVSAAVQALVHGRLELVALPAVVALLLLARRFPAAGLGPGGAAAGWAVHALAWLSLLAGAPWQAAPLAWRLLPLLLLALALLRLGGGRARQGGLVLLAVDLGLAALLWLGPLNALWPVAAWLLLALLALETSDRVPLVAGRLLVLLGAGFLLLVLLAFAPVILPAEVHLGALRARLLMELLGVAVLLRWWFRRPAEPLASSRLWRRLHPYVLEALLLALLLIGLAELAPGPRGMAWPLLALALLSPPARRLFDPRTAPYSLPFHWLGLLHLALELGERRLAAPTAFEAGDGFALAAIVLQVAYLVRIRRRIDPEPAGFPFGFATLGRFLQGALTRPLLAADDPFLLALALFIGGRFDSSLLTLLWSAQAFLVFVLSAVVRENQLRYVALVALAACLLRLLTVDLASADLGLKGAIFIGVGVLLLAMNAVYNRFRSRFE